LLLHVERLEDGRILGFTQLIGGDAMFGEIVPRREQLGRPQQAADVIGSIG
jgi:hypothetical protein